MDRRRFAGKNVIVTGASRGIGRVISHLFAVEGANVILVARTVDQLRNLADEIQASGGSAWIQDADVSDSSQVQGVVEATVDRWREIHVLINNAGVVENASPFLETREDVWDRTIDINLKGAFLMGQRVAHEMAETGGGAIVNISSIDALGADGPYVAYSSSKAGLLGLNRTMAVELAPYKIRVNAVSPGYVETEMITREVSVKALRYLKETFDRVPMRRMVQAEEVAATCLFLASDEASGITGQNIVIDCGLTANWYVFETLPD